MRWRKLDQGDNALQYRCCWCCHVRTGTLVFGMFQLLIHLAVLAYFTVCVIHPQLINSRINHEPVTPKLIDIKEAEPFGFKSTRSGSIEIVLEDSDHIDAVIQQATNPPYSDNSPTPLPDVIWTIPRDVVPLDQQFIWVLVTVISLSFVLMLVYGTLKTRPQLLMPFFCLQLFDFIATCLSSVSICSLSDTRKWIEAQQNLPYKAELLSLSNDWLMLIIVLVVVTILFFKAYLLGMVWSCYKYLTDVLRTAHSINFVHDDDEMALPPKYEDVMNIPPETYPQGPPPPPYTTIN